MSTRSSFLGVGVAHGLAAGLLVGAGLTGPGRADAAAPSAAPTLAVDSGIAIGAPAVLPPVTTSGGTVTSAGTAIAYPYYGGSPGIAPDHTIVVTGVGQADAIAADTGLTISGVLSVSASVSPSYGIAPMVTNGAVTPPCVVAVPGSGPMATGQSTLPQPVCLQPVYQQTLSVSVTVEYRVG